MLEPFCFVTWVVRRRFVCCLLPLLPGWPHFFDVWDFRVIYRLGSGLSWGQQGCCSLSLTHPAAWNRWLFAYPLIIVLSPHFLLAENTWLFWWCAGFASCLYPLLTCENDHRKGKQVTEGAAMLLPTRPTPSLGPWKFLLLQESCFRGSLALV